VKRGTLAALLAAALLGASPRPANPARGGVDATFALLAHQADDAEIDMGRLALRRSNADEARMFAQTMIDEHGTLERQLDGLTRAAAGTPRTDDIDRLAMLRLGAIPVTDFDQQYLMQQVGDHLAAISIYSTEAELGHDPQLREFAGRTLPMLRAHLQLAVDAVRHIGGSSPFKQH
jgi:putative membrane protein